MKYIPRPCKPITFFLHRLKFLPGVFLKRINTGRVMKPVSFPRHAVNTPMYARMLRPFCMTALEKTYVSCFFSVNRVVRKRLLIVLVMVIPVNVNAFPEIPFCPLGGPPGWMNRMFNHHHRPVYYAPPVYVYPPGYQSAIRRQMPPVPPGPAYSRPGYYPPHPFYTR